MINVFRLSDAGFSLTGPNPERVYAHIRATCELGLGRSFNRQAM
jgi:hypothetical protein